MNNEYGLYFEFYTTVLELEGDEAIAYCNEFFSRKDIMDDYLRQYQLTDNEMDALERLFDSDDLYERVIDALNYDKYCHEAFIILCKYQYEDEDRLYNILSNKYQEICNEDNFTEHGKDNAVLMANMYADFLNYTQETRTSIEVQDKIVELNGGFDPVLLFRYIYSYTATNDCDALFNLFEKYTEHFDYLNLHLTIIEVLLSNGREDYALNVLDDFCDRHPEVLKDDYKIDEKDRNEVKLVPDLEEWIYKNKSRGVH